MSKLNTRGTTTGRISSGTIQLGRSENNNLQYRKDAPARLFELIVSSFYGEDKSKQAEMVQLIREAVAQGAAQTVANMITYSKQDMNMRTMPIVAAVHLAQFAREFGDKSVNIRKLISDVIVRADELCDTYAYALSVFGSKNSMPLAIRRGIEDAFAKFNEYDLAKYNRDNDVKLSDLLRIVHPTPVMAEMGRVYANIIAGTLASPITWETEFSRNGQLHPSEQRSKGEIWKDLINYNKLGFLAAIRNIRNMAEANIDHFTQTALSNLIAEGHKKVLPFQIFQAYKMTPDKFVTVKDALIDAAEKSVQNVPVIGEAVWIVCDVSGSMKQKVNDKSDMTMLSTAAQLAATAVKSQLLAGKRVAFTAFATRAATMQFSRHEPVIAIASKIERLAGDLGGSTNLNTAFSEYGNVVSLIGKPDTFMVFSDMQVNDRSMYYDGSWGYSSQPAAIPNTITNIPVKVAVNFRSKETTPLARHMGFIQLSGFSEKIFQLLNILRDYDKIFSRLSRA